MAVEGQSPEIAQSVDKSTISIEETGAGDQVRIKRIVDNGNDIYLSFITFRV